MIETKKFENCWNNCETWASIILKSTEIFPFLYLLHKFVSRAVKKYWFLDGKAIPLQAILRIFNCFLFRNFSAKATNARNSAQRNSDWKPYAQYLLLKICIHNYDVSVRVMYCCCTASIPADNWLVLILLGASGLIGECFYYSW